MIDDGILGWRSRENMTEQHGVRLYPQWYEGYL